MHPLKFLYVSALSILLMPAFVDAQEGAGDGAYVISVSVDHSDGGNQGDRHMRSLVAALQAGGCNAIGHSPDSQNPAQLHFDPAPVSSVTGHYPNYQLIARAKTLAGEVDVRGAILVHASRGINDLSALQGQRIAFVGKGSPSGYQLPVKLLLDAGIEDSWDTFFYVGNHVGSISMLLHSDTDVAVAAEPLAQRWAKANDLAVVAVTDAIETGGWWLDERVPEKTIQACAQALSSLERSDLKALPAWIGGFDKVLSSR